MSIAFPPSLATLLIVGNAAISLLLSVTLKFLSKGTLKSTRIITFLPLVHISLIFFIMQT